MILFLSKYYDKLDDFGFDYVNFPFLAGDIPCASFYGVYISQLIRFASHVADFNTRNKRSTTKLLKQGYRHHKLRNSFSNSIDATTTWCQNLMGDSNLFLNQSCRNHLVCKFRKIVGRNDFLINLGK